MNIKQSRGRVRRGYFATTRKSTNGAQIRTWAVGR